MTEEQVKKFHEIYPFIDRDLGSEILKSINECEDEVIYIRDDTKFAADSLFCEWAYVVDLDKRQLEVYQGFNHTPLTEQDRFFYLQKNKEDKEYYPIKLVKSFSLDKLPSGKDFLKCLKRRRK